MLNVKKPKTIIVMGFIFVLFGIAELIFNQSEGAGKIIFLIALVIPGLIFIISGFRALYRGNRSS